MVAVVFAIVLPAAAIIVHTGHEISGVVEDATRSSAILSARELALRYRETIEVRRATLKLLASLPESHLATRGQCANWLAKASQLAGADEYLFLVDREGRIACHSKAFTGSPHVAARPYFKRAIATGDFAFDAFQPARIDQEPALALAQPVLDDSGSVLAVVVQGITAHALVGDYTQRAHLPEWSVVALLDESGRVIASAPQSAELSPEASNDVALRARASTRDFIAQPDWADRIPRLTGIARLEGMPGNLAAGVAVPSTPIRASGDEENGRNLLILAAITSLVLVIGWSVTQRLIVQRTRAITGTADRLSGGDLAARTGLPSDGGELNGIGSKLDQLADVFQRSMITAESRQNALSRTNRALRLFGEVNRLVGKADDEVELVRAFCRAAVANGGYAMACVRLRGSTLSTIVRCAARDGVEDGYIDEVDVACQSEQCPLAEHPASAAAAAQPVFSHAIDTNPCVGQRCRAAIVGGGRTAIGLPLALRDVPGTMVLVAPETTAFDADETRYLKELTAELAFGMSAIREQHAHRRTQAALELRDRAIDASRNGIVIFEYTEGNRIVSINPAVQQLLGIHEQPNAAEFRQISSHHYDDVDWQALCALIDSRREGKVAVTFLRRGEPDIRLELSLTLVDTFASGPLFGVLEVRDVTEQHCYEAQLEHQAQHDPLTSLANRNVLYDRLEQTLARAGRERDDCFAIWIDVDRFQVLHHSRGRAVADSVLIEIAHRLMNEATGCDTVARVGEDEFVLIASSLPSEEAVVSLATRLLEAIRVPIFDGEHEVTLTACIGVACSSHGEGRSADVLLRRAKTAVFNAKKSGGDTLQFYEPEMSARAARRMRLETALRHALDRNELSLVFQPKVDLLTGELTGCEALCRWQHAELGAVPPAEFISVAEESGLIPFIGRWVMEAACAQARAWLDAGVNCRRMAINVSALQFAKGNLVNDVAELLNRYRLPPQMLMVEITETSLMQNPQSAIETLGKLKSIGVKLAIDDFGTGYSSLASLRQFPIDYLKIDRSFVQDLARNPDDASIVVSIISLAHHLDLRVIAEGVETEGQMVYLRGRGCDEMQGYLFSGPLEKIAFAELLRTNRRIEFPVQLDLPERTLLLVDDEPSVQAALRRTLRRQGYTVLFATNASEALETLASHSVGIIISDFRMPGMDGIQLLRKVSSLYPDVVRIVLSGYADVDTVTAAINCGAVFRFMHKPWDDRRFLESVRQAFERFELSRAATIS